MVGKSEVLGVVLAGGEGTRLRPLSYYFQKCMVPVGRNQKPLLEYILRLLCYHGVTDVSLLVGYKHEQIVNYFEDGSRFGVNLTYVYDEPGVKGTGAALLNLYDKGLVGGRSSLLVYYGDILSNIDLAELMTRHRESEASATLALARGYQVPVGVAELKGGWVSRWVEKPKMDLYAGIGILALDSGVLGELSLLGKGLKDFDLTRDFIPYLLSRGYPVGAYVTDSYWYDIGSTEKYEKLDNGLVERSFKFLFR